MKIPYQGRNVPESAQQSGSPAGFLVDKNSFVLGNGDLIIGGELLSGSSSLEQCYGIGLTPGSTEAACFMAGKAEFDIDEIEVWALMV